MFCWLNENDREPEDVSKMATHLKWNKFKFQSGWSLKEYVEFKSAKQFKCFNPDFNTDI